MNSTDQDQGEAQPELPSVTVLLNRDALAQELLDLTRAYIARDLYVDPQDISSTFTVEDGALLPRFQIDSDKTTGFTEERVRGVMKESYARAQAVVVPRFKVLNLKRSDYYRSEGGQE